MWMALAWGLGFYFHYFGALKLNRFYGILASPVAFMIWLYCGAGAFILGAQVNASLREQSKSEVIRKRRHRGRDEIRQTAVITFLRARAARNFTLPY
jgi:uncharacterized BrkB/YihY/UPF0761 family membrane protein